MYSEIVLDHFQLPRNVGQMPAADAEAEVENPVCGDRLHVWLRLEGDRLAEMRWQADGCVPAIAAASVTSEIVRGLPIGEARALSRDDIVSALGGLPARKAHAAALAAAGLHRAMATLDKTETRT